MNDSKELFTPIYHKLESEFAWPEDEKAFYLLTCEGLFFCRNHTFFRSSVPAPNWPAELAPQSPFLRLKYPRVPQAMFERIIGFFSRMGLEYGAEAAVLLAWNTSAQSYEVVVPDQQSVVGGQVTGHPYPIEVHYQVPVLPTGWLLLGDVHSHVDEAAYASTMDKQDEVHRPGLHIVVGRLYREPPELHIEVTVDGFRFRIDDPALVIEGYTQRRAAEVPEEWISRVAVYSWGEYNQLFAKGDTAAHGGYQTRAYGLKLPPPASGWSAPGCAPERQHDNK